MKKSKIHPIVLKMGCTEKLMPDPAYLVPDDNIIIMLSTVDNINLQDAEGKTLLIYAALYERYEVIKYLLAQNADVQAQDKNQYTALHFAVQTNNVNTIKLLIEAGANVNAKEKFGNSPLMKCNNNTPKEVIEILLNNGADPTLKNNFGVSAADLLKNRIDFPNRLDP